VAQPIQLWSEEHDDNLLQWGDAGSLYLFLDDAGQVHWVEQCY
jgi:hypothetical protein